MKTERLDKFISANTTYTRSDCRKLIYTGRVSVNGSNKVKIDTKVNPESDVVLLDSLPISYKKFVYFLLNKPKGVLSACNDKNKKTVVDLLSENDRIKEVFPIGRLDKDTTGLLLLTNDGETAHKIIAPKSKIEKSYLVTLDGNINDENIELFKNGVTLADGTLCKPAILEYVAENKARIIIIEGKYHQVKRMFGVIGLGVIDLHRERIGNLVLPQNLKIGEYCEISCEDVKKWVFVNKS